MWLGLIWLVTAQRNMLFENAIESVSFTEAGKFLDQLSDY
jgi:hypothetical protein